MFDVDSIDEIITRQDNDGGESHRITLFHKNKEKHYCYITPGAGSFDKEYPYGVLVKFGKDVLKISHLFDVSMQKRETDGGHYYVARFADDDEPKEKILPFLFHEDPVEVMVDSRTNRMISEYMDLYVQNILEKASKISKTHPIMLLDMFFHERPNELEKMIKQDMTVTKNRIVGDLENLFYQDPSPSTVLQSFEINSDDRKLKRLYHEISKRKCFLFLSGLMFVPKEIGDVLLDRYNVKFRNKFSVSKKLENRSLISSFSLSNPQVRPAIDNMWSCAKIYSGLLGLTTQAGLTAGAYLLDWDIPTAILGTSTVASGLTMAKNLVTSRGRNPNGIIASVLGYVLTNKID